MELSFDGLDALANSAQLQDSSSYYFEEQNKRKDVSKRGAFAKPGRSRILTVYRVWAVILSLLAVIFVLTKCSSFAYGLRGRRSAGRHLAGREDSEENELDLDKIISMCLELEAANPEPLGYYDTQLQAYSAQQHAWQHASTSQQQAQASQQSTSFGIWEGVLPHSSLQPEPYLYHPSMQWGSGLLSGSPHVDVAPDSPGEGPSTSARGLPVPPVPGPPTHAAEGYSYSAPSMETSAPLSFEGVPVSSFAESGEIRVLHPAQPGTTPDFQAPLVRPKTPNRNGEVPGALSVRKRSGEVGAAPIPLKKAKDLPQPRPGTSTEAGIRGTPTPDSSRQEESSSALIRALLRKPAYVVGSSGFSLGAVNPSDDADRSSKAERTSQTSVHSIALPRKPTSSGGSSGFSLGAVNPSDDADRSSKEERTSQTRVHSTALPGKPTSSGGSSVSSLGAVNLSDDRGRRSTAEGNTQTGAHIRALLRKPASLGGSSGFSLGAVDPSGDPDKRLTAEGTTEMAGLLDLEALRCHPYYRTPALQPGATSRPFSLAAARQLEASSNSIGFALLYMHSLLSQDMILQTNLEGLVCKMESLASHLLSLHELRATALSPKEACRVLGLRYLILDALFVASDVLRQAGNDRSWWRELVQNIPVEVVDYKHIVTFRPQCVANIRLAKKLIPAIEQLKMGVRPCVITTIQLKRRIFCKDLSPAYFRRSSWDAWRKDCPK